MYFPVVEVCFCCVLYRNLPPHPQMASDVVHRKWQAFLLTISLAWLSLPLSFPLLSLPPSLLQSTAGPPSLWSVSMLFHLACCYRGLGAGRLQLASQSFSIYLSSPCPHLPPPRLALAPVGINPHAHTYSHLSDPPSISLLLHLSPSLPSSLFRLARKCSSRAQRQKRNIVSGEAFKLEEAARVVLLLRALSPPMTPESGEYRSLVTQSIQQIALTKLVEAFNSKVSSLGGGPGEKSNWAPLHGGF